MRQTPERHQDAAGADLSRVFIISAVKGEDGKGHLVVFDPISSYLGRVDSHKNADLRAVLEPIGEMSSRLRVATLAVTHLNK
jgi:putative DNA primase/helicase